MKLHTLSRLLFNNIRLTTESKCIINIVRKVALKQINTLTNNLSKAYMV